MSKGFSIVEMLIVMILMSVMLVVMLPVLTVKKKSATLSSYVQQCVKNGAISISFDSTNGKLLSINDTSCNAVVNECVDGGSVCNDVINYAKTGANDTIKLGAKKVLRAACDKTSGSTLACNFFVERCQNSECDITSGIPNKFLDVDYYLKMSSTDNINPGRSVIESLIQPLYSSNNANIKNEINKKSCITAADCGCTDLACSGTKNTACSIRNESSAICIINNCNYSYYSGNTSACPIGYQNNWNRSCKQILNQWPTPSGFIAGAYNNSEYYRITTNGTDSSSYLNTVCDMPKGGWTAYATNNNGYNQLGYCTFYNTTYLNGYNQNGMFTTPDPLSYTCWAHKASLFDNFSNITMKLAMGSVTDYFKPITTTATTFSQMISGYNKHQWSSAEAGPYIVPSYFIGHLGGSTIGWPSSHGAGTRSYLSFWGTGGLSTGGCCSISTTDTTDIWQRPFTLWVKENNISGSHTSCKSIKETYPSSVNGFYTIDPDGDGGNAPFNTYCDMTTDGGGWTVLKSCKEHLAYKSYSFSPQTTGDGEYMIDPVSYFDEKKPFKVYCDMTNDGGGWTLVMKINGQNDTFKYSSNYWTGDSVYNPGSLNLTEEEHKSLAYSELNDFTLFKTVFKSFETGTSGTPLIQNLPANGQNLKYYATYDPYIYMPASQVSMDQYLDAMPGVYYIRDSHNTGNWIMAHHINFHRFGLWTYQRMEWNEGAEFSMVLLGGSYAAGWSCDGTKYNLCKNASGEYLGNTTKTVKAFAWLYLK